MANLSLYRGGVSLGVLAFALAMGPAVANAQNNATLEEVIVTAERRSETLQTTPITVNAVTADMAAARGINRAEDLNIAVPALNVSRTVAAPVIFMRGVGNNSATAGQEQNVAFYIDDVYYPSMTAALTEFNNIERIEVLKGPQGTLFGRNTTGGLVHIITKDPAHEPSGKVQAGYANYETVSGSAYFTTGLTDTLAADLSATGYKQSKGWGHNIFNGREVNKRNSLALRSKALWTPTDDTRITLTGDYSRTKGDVGSTRQRLPGPLLQNLTTATGAPLTLNGVPANYANAPFNGVPFNGNIYDSNTDTLVDDLITAYSGSLKIEQFIGPVLLKSITAAGLNKRRSTFDTDNTPLYLSRGIYDPADEISNFSQEVHVSSADESRIQWILGGFYYHSEGKSFLRSGSAAAFTRFNDKITTNSLSGFAQATIPLGERTRITAGGRYTTDKKTVAGGAFNSAGVQVLFAFNPPSKRWNNFTYRLGLDHQITDDIMAYANVSTGFKSGLFDLVGPNRPAANPEKLTAFEGGLKMYLADRRVRLNLAGYRYNYKDLQIRAGSTSDPLTTFLRNVGKTRIWGLEADGEVLITENLRLSGGAAYLNAKYTDFPLVQTFNIVGGVGVGVTSANLRGNYLPRSPKFTGNLALVNTVPSEMGKFTQTFSIYHNSGFSWEPNNLLKEPDYTLASAELGWTSRDEHLTVKLWARNLFDQKYYIYVNTAAATPPAGAPGEPRTYGVQLGYSF